MRLKSLPPPRHASGLLSLDFDDTLYDRNSADKVPREFFDLIRDWRARFGLLWGINTGRSYDFLEEGYLREAGAPFAPDFVISMERNIHLADEGLHLRPLTVWNDKCRDDHHCLFTRYKAAFQELFLELEERFRSVGWQHQGDDEYSIEVEEPDDLNRMVEVIETFVKRHPDISAQRAGPYLRFCHAEYNKGTALQEVSVMLGIPADGLFILGDGHNDLDALIVNVSAICAAPSNAVAPLKEMVLARGGYVSSLPYGCGVMDALHRHILPLLAGRGGLSC